MELTELTELMDERKEAGGPLLLAFGWQKCGFLSQVGQVLSFDGQASAKLLFLNIPNYCLVLWLVHEEILRSG